MAWSFPIGRLFGSEIRIHVTFLLFLVWLGVGIRQVIVFWRWRRKYRAYKEQQKRLEENLDFEKEKGGSSHS